MGFTLYSFAWEYLEHVANTDRNLEEICVLRVGSLSILLPCLGVTDLSSCVALFNLQYLAYHADE